MRAIALCSLAALLTLSAINSSHAQAPVNPDLSVIADTRFFSHNDKQARPDESGKLQLNFEELELDINGYLNPYARADVALAIAGTGGEVDVEEAFLTLLRGLPLNLQFRVGQLQPDFGKINTQHPHLWGWINRPLMFQEAFGEEGLHDVGGNLTTLIPVSSFALGISASVLKTGNLLSSGADDSALAFDAATPRTPAALGRISLFSPLGDYTSLEMGVSYLKAQEAFKPEARQSANLANFDFKLKWTPNQYRALILVAEAVLNNHKITTLDSVTANYSEETMNAWGALASVDYRFRKRFEVGAFYDFTQRASNTAENLSGYGVFVGFNLAEETTHFGLLLRRDQGAGMDGYNTAMLQILWALGPHKPHQF